MNFTYGSLEAEINYIKKYHPTEKWMCNFHIILEGIILCKHFQRVYFYHAYALCVGQYTPFPHDNYVRYCHLGAGRAHHTWRNQESSRLIVKRVETLASMRQPEPRNLEATSVNLPSLLRKSVWERGGGIGLLCFCNCTQIGQKNESQPHAFICIEGE